MAAIIACPKDQSTDVTLQTTETGKAMSKRTYLCNACGQQFVVWMERMEGAVKKANRK